MDVSVVQYEHPCMSDGANVYQLIKHCPPLDVNSQYYYYILCRDFQQTCAIARCDNLILGFISSFIKPEDVNCLFIWQIAVLKEIRQKRVGSNMLRWLIQQSACQQITSLEATVSPSNHASQNLFRSFAQEYGASCQVTTFLASSQFHNQVHEEEMLWRISFFRENPLCQVMRTQQEESEKEQWHNRGGETFQLRAQQYTTLRPAARPHCFPFATCPQFLD